MFFASDNSGPVPPQVLEALARAGERGDDAASQRDTTDAVIADVADVEIAAVVQGDRVRYLEPGLGGRTAVAAESRLAGSSDGADGVCLCVNSTNQVVLHLDEEHVSRRVESHLVGFIAGRVGRGTAITGVALSAAGDGRDQAGCLFRSTPGAVGSRQ